MKKITIVLSIVAAILISGCVMPKYITKMTEQRHSALINIETVEATDISLTIKITNLTNEILEIQWIKSSLDDSGVLTDSHRAFTSGMINTPSLILLPKKTIIKNIYKSDGTGYIPRGYLSGWSYGHINWPATLAIKAKGPETEDYVIIDVDIEAKPASANQWAQDPYAP